MDTSGPAVVAAARLAGVTIAAAESITGGLVAAALTDAPGSSDVFLGGVVAYGSTPKMTVLGVSAAVLDTAGPVSEATAMAMAVGARSLFGADIAVSTTGAAGPEPHGGQPAGVVCIAVVSGTHTSARTLNLAGGRDNVRLAAVAEALHDVVTMVTGTPTTGTSVG